MQFVGCSLNLVKSGFMDHLNIQSSIHRCNCQANYGSLCGGLQSFAHS